ncbi:IS4 family transposase, partial [Salmonella enterica]|nr:IS4 family transposase [Salmonella enterica]
MPLLNDLLDFSDYPLMPPPSAQLFAEHLPVEWIQHCLTLSAHATVRRRRLPGDMVMRLVALMNLGSHMLLDAATAPYRRSEILMAQSLTASIPDNSVTLFDKLFYSADLLLTLSRQGNNRHWLLPARKNMVAETEESYGSGDRLLKLKVSPQARKKNPSLPEFW